MSSVSTLHVQCSSDHKLNFTVDLCIKINKKVSKNEQSGHNIGFILYKYIGKRREIVAIH